jgi:hypothetical protein
MLRTGTAMFLLIPGKSPERVLHPGKVTESDGASFVAEFAAPLHLIPALDVNTFTEVNGKFMQQGAVVVDVRCTSPAPIASFRRVGDPVSAEARQTYRISTVMEGIVALIGNEELCRVVDVSPEGFAGVIGRDYQLGSLTAVTLNYEGRTFSAVARVQAIKGLPDGRLRYGFYISDKKSAARKILEQVGASIQRTQLRRLAGAA